MLAAFFPRRGQALHERAREAGLSRLLGGIHVRADDETGRAIGAAAGRAALSHAGR